MTVQPELVDVLFRGLDALEAYLAEILETANEGTEDNEDIINTPNSIAQKASGKEEDPKEEAKPAAAASSEMRAQNMTPFPLLILKSLRLKKQRMITRIFLALRYTFRRLVF